MRGGSALFITGTGWLSWLDSCGLWLNVQNTMSAASADAAGSCAGAGAGAGAGTRVGAAHVTAGASGHAGGSGGDDSAAGHAAGADGDVDDVEAQAFAQKMRSAGKVRPMTTANTE